MKAKCNFPIIEIPFPHTHLISLWAPQQAKWGAELRIWVTWLTRTRPITIQWKKKWKSSGFITALYPNPIRHNPSKEDEDSSEFHHSHYKPSKGEGVSSVYHHGSIFIPIQPTVNHKEERSLKNPGALKNRQLTWQLLPAAAHSPHNLCHPIPLLYVHLLKPEDLHAHMHTHVTEINQWSI